MRNFTNLLKFVSDIYPNLHHRKFAIAFSYTLKREKKNNLEKNVTQIKNDRGKMPSFYITIKKRC